MTKFYQCNPVIKALTLELQGTYLCHKSKVVVASFMTLDPGQVT